MASSPAFGHPLRWLMIQSFLPCFILNVVFIIIKTYESSMVGLFLHFFSTFLSIIFLSIDKSRDGDAIQLQMTVDKPDAFFKHPFFLLVLDTLLATFFTCVLIAGYSAVPWNGSVAVLLTYSTLGFLICW